MADLAGITDVPVAAGCARPFLRPLRVAPHIHGTSGLGGVELAESARVLDERHAVDVIIDTVMGHEPGEVTLVPVGPLTNIAMAARKEPRIVERVREVVLMGGGVHRGNCTPVAEFNVACDPESAAVVFDAGWPVTMVGLNLTYQATAGPDVLARVAGVGGPVAEFVVDVIGHYRESYRSVHGIPAPPLHDPCAVAYVADQAVMTTRRVPVSVETSGALTTGMTVVDERRPVGPECPTQVGVDLDAGRFWDLLVDALGRLSGR